MVQRTEVCRVTGRLIPPPREKIKRAKTELTPRQLGDLLHALRREYFCRRRLALCIVLAVWGELNLRQILRLTRAELRDVDLPRELEPYRKKYLDWRRRQPGLGLCDYALPMIYGGRWHEDNARQALWRAGRKWLGIGLSFGDLYRCRQHSDWATRYARYRYGYAA